MDDTFKIFVYRLKEGAEEKIDENLSPEFMDIHEAELAFNEPIRLHGTATVTDEMLLLRLGVETSVVMACAICNQEVKINISLTNFYITEPLSSIRNGVYDYRDTLREEILLALPFRAECNSGDCPERANVAKYLTKNEE